ncbi:hypothetical protein BDV37DRAFT_185669 [Aspergillus pseudonomiae]|uniref:Uncharacterized protein n=1 Tax=Aspergillus pseudonomiae TaxID=1506151 RepID=A0A5N7D431_9EURO|nr:uncharacterized protein BDV37DRAFT_185669 [Aspergillus pseudonomiae]KAE8401166.1 hypothetical protein BDV37DRAFT_185669 [Aspergillus pseudonomiae]
MPLGWSTGRRSIAVSNDAVGIVFVSFVLSTFSTSSTNPTWCLILLEWFLDRVHTGYSRSSPGLPWRAKIADSDVCRPYGRRRHRYLGNGWLASAGDDLHTHASTPTDHWSRLLEWAMSGSVVSVAYQGQFDCVKNNNYNEDGMGDTGTLYWPRGWLFNNLVVLMAYCPLSMNPSSRRKTEWPHH